MSYNLTVSEIEQIVRLIYRCSDGTPAMQTAGFGLVMFTPDRVEVSLRRKTTATEQSAPWTAVWVSVYGWPTSPSRHRVGRNFRPPFNQTAVPPWLDTLLAHAGRMVTDGATLPLPAVADTVTA